MLVAPAGCVCDSLLQSLMQYTPSHLVKLKAVHVNPTKHYQSHFYVALKVSKTLLAMALVLEHSQHYDLNSSPYVQSISAQALVTYSFGTTPFPCARPTHQLV